MPHVTMKRAQQRIPVLAQLPTAFWITGATLDARDIGLKQTTNLAWDNVYLNAEELAVLVPISNNLIEDMDYDFWTEVKPKVTEAFAVALDDAIFFGTNAPTTWPTAIVPATATAGNQFQIAAAPDFLNDVSLGMCAVEADGFDVTGFWARRQVKASLRKLRTTTNAFLLYGDDVGPQASPNMGTLFGEPIIFSNAGLSSFATGAANFSMIGGQWDQSMLAIREDISMQMFDQGVITDNSSPPQVQFNLIQQDMVVLRVIARFAWAVPNPINRQQQTKASRYPFFSLQQKAATGGEG